MNKVPTYRQFAEPYRPPIEQLEHRIACLRRRYGQGLNRRPSAEELAAMKRAAALTVISDYALTDPACDANTQVRLTNAAARARSAMEALLEQNAPPEYRPSLAEMLAEAAS
jgi:hypothetical protein